jgi:hypothetical protein
MICRKKILACRCNQVNKTVHFWKLQCWYYWWEWFMNYMVEMASGGMIYIPSLMTISLGIWVILRVGYTSTIWEAIVLVLLMRGIYYVCYWDGLRWHDKFILSFMKIVTCIQAILTLSGQSSICNRHGDCASMVKCRYMSDKVCFMFLPSYFNHTSLAGTVDYTNACMNVLSAPFCHLEVIIWNSWWMNAIYMLWHVTC